MEIHDRIRYLRKDCLKLSQEKFGLRLGVSRDVIKNIELNLLAKPEQKEPLIKLICKEFNVEYNWLVDGRGEIFIETDESVVDAVAEEYKLGEFDKEILKIFLTFTPEQKQTLKDFAFSLVDTVLNNDTLYMEYRGKCVSNNTLQFAARNGDATNIEELVTDFDNPASDNEPNE